MTYVEWKEELHALDDRINNLGTWNDHAERLQREYDQLLANYPKPKIDVIGPAHTLMSRVLKLMKNHYGEDYEGYWQWFQKEALAGEYKLQQVIEKHLEIV